MAITKFYSKLAKIVRENEFNDPEEDRSIVVKQYQVQSNEAEVDNVRYFKNIFNILLKYYSEAPIKNDLLITLSESQKKLLRVILSFSEGERNRVLSEAISGVLFFDDIGPKRDSASHYNSIVFNLVVDSFHEYLFNISRTNLAEESIRNKAIRNLIICHIISIHEAFDDASFKKFVTTFVSASGSTELRDSDLGSLLELKRFKQIFQYYIGRVVTDEFFEKHIVLKLLKLAEMLEAVYRSRFLMPNSNPQIIMQSDIYKDCLAVLRQHKHHIVPWTFEEFLKAKDYVKRTFLN